MKVCTTCGEEKDLSMFYKRKKSVYRSSCKECMNKASREYVLNNPEVVRKISRESARRRKSKRVESTIRSQEKYPERYLYYSASSRSLKTGVEFSIKPSDIIIPDVCPVFGTPFQRGTEYAASLDRIDSSKGYTPDNIQVISKLANTMKSNATEDQLIKFSKWILNGR